jgi:acid phosphatase
MARAAQHLGSSFIVTTGDNFYTFGVSSDTDSQWRTSFEDIYREEALQVPWYPVLGNHDYAGDVWAQVKRTRTSPRWCMTDRWHDLRATDQGRPDVHLIFIDTIAWQGRESFPFASLGTSTDSGDQRAQLEWLTSTLRSDAAIKIVFGHHPIYSVGKHGGRPKMMDLDEMLRENGVIAYVSGHDHCLYHIKHKGMDYICSGGGSEELAYYTGDRLISGCVLRSQCDRVGSEGELYPVWKQFIAKAGFAALQVGPSGLDFFFIDRDGLMSRSTHIE